MLDRVRAAIAAGASPTIIVTKVDRFGRDTEKGRVRLSRKAAMEDRDKEMAAEAAPKA